MFLAAPRRAAIAALTAAVLAGLAVAAPAASAATSIDNPGAALAANDLYQYSNLGVAATGVACDGVPHTGTLFIYDNGRYLTGVSTTDGVVDGEIWISLLPGSYEMTAAVSSCGSNRVLLGHITVHSRDTTVSAAPATPGPYPAGAPVTFDVAVTNSGPDLVDGIAVAEVGDDVLPADVTDGAASFTIPSLPPGVTSFDVRFVDPHSVWEDSPRAPVMITAAPEVPTLTPLSVPDVAYVGAGLHFSVQIDTAVTELPVEYFDSVTATVDGESVPGGDGGFPWWDGPYSSWVNFNLILEGVAPGTRTVEVNFAAAGTLAASSTSFDIEVTRWEPEITASAPAEVTWGEEFEVTTRVTGFLGVSPVDGTIEVLDGDTVVGTATATPDPGPVAVPVAGVGVGEGRELTVRYDGGSSFEPASTTITVDVVPAAFELSASVDHTSAGVPATLTITATPPAGAPSGLVHIFRDGMNVATMHAADGTMTTSFLPRAGDTTVRLDYDPDVAHFAPTTFEETFEFDAPDTSLDSTVSYTAPSKPNSTGTLSGTVCVSADVAGVSPDAFSDAFLDLDLTHHDASSTHRSQVAVTDLGGGCFGAEVSDADLPPGDHNLTAAFPGNDYLAPSGQVELDFTVVPAPTEMGLAVVGDPGDVAGMTTQLRATLSEPVPGHTHTGAVTFYVNGDAVGTVAADGRAAELAVTLPAGAVEVSAHYSGDVAHAATTSAPLLFDVDQATATVELSATPTQVRLGDTSTLTATVTIDDPGALDPSSFLFATALGSPVHAAAAAGTPATGEVTFYVNGSPVGTRTLIGGVASMQYVFGAGNNAVSVSYSGSADVAAVAAGAVAPVDVVVAAPEVPDAPALPADPSPPTASGDTAPPTPAAPRGPAGPASGQAAVGTMAHTGAEAGTLVPLAAVLLVAGLVLTRVRRRAG